MQFGIQQTGTDSAGHLSRMNYRDDAERNGERLGTEDWIASLADAADRQQSTEETVQKKDSARSEAVKIYEAATAGKKNPAEDIRQAPKVPYGYLAKDGVISYNGVNFFCDERTNSICLGDMTDKKNVITVALSGGGHLKVNRDNLGELSRAVDMFSPEDLNLIMRAIAKDAKVQSMKQEIDDMENSIGNQVANETDAVEKEEPG